MEICRRWSNTFNDACVLSYHLLGLAVPAIIYGGSFRKGNASHVTDWTIADLISGQDFAGG
jgi:hypothetical protein